MKVGSKIVIWPNNSWDHPPSIAKIVGETKKCWKVDDGNNYRKTSGLREKIPGEGKDRPYIDENFKDARGRLNHDERMTKAKGAYSRIYTTLWLWKYQKDYTEEQLKALEEIEEFIVEKIKKKR